MNWRFKAKIYEVLAIIPFGIELHYLLQRYATKELPRKNESLDQLLVATKRLLDTFKQKNKTDISRATFVEIGAGRDLAVPMALRMLGVGHVISIDVSRLAKPFLISHAAKHIAKQLNVNFPKLNTWGDLKEYSISYCAPSYLHEIELGESTADCFFSVDTLEHIPKNELHRIFVDSVRFLKKDGLSVHFIDYSDHYARVDSLSRFNFLRYSDDEWERYNNKFQYVNRMRHSEYVDLMKKSGFEIVNVEPDIEQPDKEILKGLDSQFKAFELNDLFTIRAKISAIPIKNN
jgi:hypothetical protein